MFQTVLSFAKSIEFFFQRRDFDPLYKNILGLVIFQLNQHHRNHKTKPTQQLPALHYKKYSTRRLRDHHHNCFYNNKAMPFLVKTLKSNWYEDEQTIQIYTIQILL